MKMKDVCKKTQLTERTVRYYVERELISPASEVAGGRTYLSFTEQDVEQLLAIAELRKLEFGIEEIIRMQHSPPRLERS
ncbi:MerR family transcriptional regulator [Paenibacillus daejeonensis]|uniref:MerR family transcriptional regulator n=1 Tax=Paenibacillus daejeonensis TaxID=135193 RepID=UPI000375662D|nr:MerR family transcriptional regulator [Paenibacillus daejeonensis]